MQLSLLQSFLTFYIIPSCLALPQDSRIGPFNAGRGQANDRPANANPADRQPDHPVTAPQTYDNPPGLPQLSSRAQGIREAFQFAWNGYKENAFPNDEFNPVSNTASNSRNGWGATAVDALSTAILMGLPTPVNTILDHIATIDYKVSKDDASVDLFERTIRYLGGMLSAYDLLSEPSMSWMVKDKKKIKTLLKQSENLADQLSFAFDTESGVPANDLFFGNHSTDGDKYTGLAAAGSLILEWTRLSDLTGNKKYADMVNKAEKVLTKPLPKANEPFPGLIGSNVSLATGQFQDAIGGWIGGTDSYYEYLIKMFVYDSKRFEAYKDRWVTAVDSSIKHLASDTEKNTTKDLTFFAYYNGEETVDVSEHLECFNSGNIILGGQKLGRKDYIEYGKKLVASCRKTYTSTITGLGPEIFGWNASAVPDGLENFYKKNGWYQLNGVYALRPEVLEGYYQAYQVTKDPKYQEWAWEAFQAVNRTCRVGSGYSSIKDVSKPNGGGFLDRQESFFFAETLKYAFLMFAPQTTWTQGTGSQYGWVFNTEGHPFKADLKEDVSSMGYS